MQKIIILMIFLCFLPNSMVLAKHDKCLICYLNDNHNQSPERLLASINNNVFKVEIANTSPKRKLGLMNRENMQKDYGMLFVFDQEKKHGIWMKSMLFSLDILWFNSNLEIIDIAKNISPCISEYCTVFKPKKKAKYVLEINAGLVDKFGIKIGQKLAMINKI